jgi:hypothetical protein
MNTVQHSVVVAIPFAEANQEWTQFTLRTTIGDHKVTAPEQEWSLDDELRHEADVRFAELDADHTRVSVVVEYRGADATGVAILQHLARQLEEYRTFVEGRV